ncbi:RIO1-domain-containing protein [Fistulina hepatica ATCC 64428]|uniref:Serine/threonine-protein kinase RIO1 n=1 Tax=Fistulina hepatica ATCC 64428 TaxID=1128425 RepID=A0A0D7A3H3_9AGAR|nr:RIO1-domain-containing protein [Fistulina hepatica ATCC 64428]
MRTGSAYIDITESDFTSEPEDLDSDDISDADDDYDDTRVEDEDWEIAEGDFTKQYNRLRQHVAVRTGNAVGVASAINTKAAVATLPAVNHPKSATAGTVHAYNKTADRLEALSKYSSKLAKIDVPYSMGVGVNRKGPSSYANMKDRSDRATTEQVLDPRTRVILLKMIGRGVVDEVNGCVSTGKEANVYHALAPDRKHLALKIYKTSILIFKDRDKYVTGEHRFRRGYSRRNPRKMVRLWAEKEMRNLRRLVAAQIRCPEPIEVRENVLVMSFLGDKEGWASPRLKDAELPADCTDLYIELVCIVRRMYHECKLVHADLSEYNIIYHEEHLFIIDVSQSVEHDHPSAFDFLRKDLKNVEDFFGRRNVPVLGLRRMFEYVTRDAVEEGDESDENALRRWIREEQRHDPETQDAENGAESAAHEDSVFMRSYIPRTLNEVYDPERDLDILKRGEGSKLIYANTMGLASPPQALRPANTKKTSRVHFEAEPRMPSPHAHHTEESSGEDSEGGDGEDAEASSTFEKKPRGHRHEDREAKKVCVFTFPCNLTFVYAVAHQRFVDCDLTRDIQERKKATKTEARERRKNKIPKADKKKSIKRSTGGK